MTKLATITIELPAELAAQLATAEQTFTADILQRGLRDLRIEQSLARYREGGISFGAAAHLAGLTQSELAQLAYARGMEPPFSDETLTEDLFM